MTKRLLIIAAACLLLVALVLVWQRASPPDAIAFHLQAFRDEFNQHAGDVRLIVMLSPT